MPGFGGHQWGCSASAKQAARYWRPLRCKQMLAVERPATHRVSIEQIWSMIIRMTVVIAKDENFAVKKPGFLSRKRGCQRRFSRYGVAAHTRLSRKVHKPKRLLVRDVSSGSPRPIGAREAVRTTTECPEAAQHSLVRCSRSDPNCHSTFPVGLPHRSALTYPHHWASKPTDGRRERTTGPGHDRSHEWRTAGTAGKRRTFAILAPLGAIWARSACDRVWPHPPSLQGRRRSSQHWGVAPVRIGAPLTSCSSPLSCALYAPVANSRSLCVSPHASTT